MSIDIQNAGEFAVLNINGAIGRDVLSADFQERLNALDESVSEIRVNITTRGGSVIDGHAMFGMLRETGKRIVTTIIGGAYSAGAVLSQAGDERRMHSNALLMIHGASGGSGAMTADQHRGMLQMIEKANEVIAETLAKRTGRPLETMNGFLSGPDNWMTAREAKAAGFIDTIVLDKTPNAEFADLVPTEIFNEIGACLPRNSEPKEPEEMADKLAEKSPATSKEIKAACDGCSAEFVLEQLENSATIDDVKDAWIKQLTSSRTEAEAKAVEEAEKAERLTQELAEAKAKPPKSGVDPVNSGSGNSTPAADPIAAFDDAVKEKVSLGMDRQRAMSSVIAEAPELHQEYLTAYRDGVRSRLG